MATKSSFPFLVFIAIMAIGGAVAFGLHSGGAEIAARTVLGLAIFFAFFFASSIQVAAQWNKAVVLRLGKFRALEGPGLFFIIPLIDTIPYWIDTRVLTSSFKAEKTLTKIPSLSMSMPYFSERSSTLRRRPLPSQTIRAQSGGPLRPPCAM